MFINLIIYAILLEKNMHFIYQSNYIIVICFHQVTVRKSTTGHGGF